MRLSSNDARQGEPPQPPSDPRPFRARDGRSALPPLDDRLMRVQLAAALLLGVGLVGGGIYLWRHPRNVAAQEGDVSGPSDSASAAVIGPPPSSVEAGSARSIALSEPRILGCHDRGIKVTPADQCDHLARVEKAFSNAVEQSAACVPSSLSGATIQYVADVSFSRHKVSLILPRSGRSLHDHKVLLNCANAIRGAMATLGLDGIDHEHARYKISLTATYRPAPTTGG